jgi:hypothetical protein
MTLKPYFRANFIAASRYTSIAMHPEFKQIESLEFQVGDLVPGDMFLIEQPGSQGWYERPYEYLLISTTPTHDNLLDLQVLKTGTCYIYDFTSRPDNLIFVYDIKQGQ